MSIQVGDAAPEFDLQDQHGAVVRLSDFAGKQNVIVVFYPFAFSGVCTGELCEIRDHMRDLGNESTAMLAVSCDPMFSLRAFSDRDSYDFPLLSDFWPHGEVAAAYGSFDEQRGCAERATFIIDRAGVVRWSVRNEMSQARNLEDYRTEIARLA